MPSFAAVFARTDSGWIAADADLAQSEQPEDVTDLLREAALEAPGDLVVLLVEDNDAWFGVVRVDGEDDPRVFVSDASAAQAAPGVLGELLLDLVTDGLEAKADGDPVGDPALLGDLGTAEERLMRLSDRAVPTDALDEIAQSAGFADELDALRV
ncbi:tRNA adenosine deaminase-associated protein [Actinocorallia sp. A-T 12471]|uniref:tRNA adenosine deaminase-associated protein n=1 Tax=Actinocorallia sp. A-T 12471 TaxID=3089813 RepID=UPI0029D0FA84|nr:tRNA adenosine deaminase-associated protein [Actinocorallia sp. A-T 12471]MDX6742695.1 tRNA adenosine deaminase-associated protein [Actinocorallia sp. A-T 12471]